MDGDLTDWFKTTVGVRQGCNLSPDLFNLILEAMMAKALEDHDTGVSINGQIVSNLRFADDIDLIADSPEDLQNLTDYVDKTSTRFGLCINGPKTKTLTIGKQREELKIKLGNQELEQVPEFVYLGGTVTENGSCSADIKRRIALASAAFGKLQKLWKSAAIKRVTKVHLYEALVKPVALYGAECWTLKAEDEQKILVAEMSWLRRILGVSRRQHIRNTIIRDKLGQQETLVQKIQTRRLTWFGHVTRMKTTQFPNMALHCNIEGNRSRGRPRKQWIDNIKQDLAEKNTNLGEAVKMVRNRGEWRRFIQPHRRLSVDS